MGTAVLEESCAGVAEDEDVVWGAVEAGADVSKQESFFESLTREFRLDGYDAVFVEENDDGLDIRKYLDKKVLKRLDEMKPEGRNLEKQK